MYQENCYALYDVQKEAFIGDSFKEVTNNLFECIIFKERNEAEKSVKLYSEELQKIIKIVEITLKAQIV